jgi:hypothetical protein
MGNIVAIWGSPQSGKTEITIALAKFLARNYGVVGLISAEDYAEMAGKLDVYIPNGSGIAAAISSEESINKYAIEVKNEKGLFLISASPTDSSLDLIFTQEQAQRLLKNAGHYFPLVLVDCTTAKNNAITGEAVALADKVIVPIGGKMETKYWFDSNHYFFELIKDKTVFCRNCTTKAFDYKTLEMTMGLSPKCAIPYCKEMPELASNGQGLLEGGSKMRDAIDQLAFEIVHLSDVSEYLEQEVSHG